MSGNVTAEDEETCELFRLRAEVERLKERIEEILSKDSSKTREINIIVPENRGLAKQVATLTAENARLKAEVGQLTEGAVYAEGMLQWLDENNDKLRASNEAIAASLEAQVEAARKDELAVCLDLAADAMSPFAGTDNDAHNEACRRIIHAIKQRGAR